MSYQHKLLKYVSKIYGLNFEIVAVTRTCIRFLSFRIVFQSSDRVERDFFDSEIKIALSLKTRETKKIKISSQGTYNLQILGNETLIIVDCEYIKIFRFALLDIKL